MGSASQSLSRTFTHKHAQASISLDGVLVCDFRGVVDKETLITLGQYGRGEFGGAPAVIRIDGALLCVGDDWKIEELNWLGGTHPSAIVCTPEQLDSMRVYSLKAAALGALRVAFLDFEQAKAWLLGSTATTRSFAICADRLASKPIHLR